MVISSFTLILIFRTLIICRVWQNFRIIFWKAAQSVLLWRHFKILIFYILPVFSFLFIYYFIIIGVFTIITTIIFTITTITTILLLLYLQSPLEKCSWWVDSKRFTHKKTSRISTYHRTFSYQVRFYSGWCQESL